MSEHQERLKKMQVLGRLRQFERDASAFSHMSNEKVLAHKRDAFESKKSGYEAVHVLQSQYGFNPDTHPWRLAAISELRSATMTAESELQQARNEWQASQRELLHKELEKKLADHAHAEAKKISNQQLALEEFVDVLDMQLFRIKEAI